MPMQAIRTRYAGPTGSSGSRIIATAQAGRAIFPYDHALDTDGNHRAAAEQLANRFDWLDACQLTSGVDSRGDHVHVLTLKPATN